MGFGTTTQAISHIPAPQCGHHWRASGSSSSQLVLVQSSGYKSKCTVTKVKKSVTLGHESHYLDANETWNTQTFIRGEEQGLTCPWKTP